MLDLNSLRRLPRVLGLGAAVAVSTGLAGCDGLLDVEDPQAIQVDQLQDPFYLGLATNGVVNEFQRMFDDVVLFTGVFTDELRNHATFQEEPAIDMRAVDSGNGTAGNLVYAQIQRTRALADSAGGLFRALRGDSANADLRYARVLAYGGTTYVLMSEVLCDAPVNMGAPNSPEKLLRDFAIPRFEEAIRVATAARAETQASRTPNSRIIAGADSLINLSRVGIARASLNLYGFSKGTSQADRQRGLEAASAVPANFLFFAFYSDAASELNNLMWSRLTAGTAASVNNTPFFELRGADPRLAIPSTHKVVSAGVPLFVPNSSIAYSTYTGTLPGTPVQAGSNIRVASGLEARYIRAELEGPTGENIAFIESRRQIAPGTAGTATATQPTIAANYFANLRDQRRRDFYLDAHRLGDLRRYRTQYTDLEQISQFEQGPYLGSATAVFADNYCFPVNAAERAANPHYRDR